MSVPRVCVRARWSAMLVMVMVVVRASGAKIVHQPDGIISIITELEPEKAPVAYLQAVESPGQRRAPPAEEPEDTPKLPEGAYRVRSAKIRIVDPETGFKVVHDSTPQREPQKELKDDEKSTVTPSVEGERRNEIRAEPANDVKIVFPSRSKYSPDTEDFQTNYNRDRDLRNGYRRRKVGQYGYQTPRRANSHRDNTVRTEKTTRIRNNNEPPKIYKETIVRPMTQNDEFVTRRKPGKIGRYRTQRPSVGSDEPGQFRTPSDRVLDPVPAIGEVVNSPSVNIEASPANRPDRRKSKKEYSSRTIVKFPDGYEQGNENRVESSSRYKTGSNVRNSYKSPTVTRGDVPAETVNRKFDREEAPTSKPPNSIKDKLESDNPKPEGSSFVGSEVVDDGLVNDGGIIYNDGIGVGGGGYADDYGKEKHFEKDKGKHYEAGHHSAHGGKGQKGYNNEEAFAKGKEEKHGHDEHKGFSAEKEGEKKSHLDKASHFHAGHKASEGQKDTDYHKEKGHKKGHKKSGFRTVHHKDEYKKKEEFFDEELDSAGVHKQGHTHQEHAEKAGGKDKKAHLDEGHYNAHRGHEGGSEKGHGYNKHKGFQKEKGHSGHYGNEEEYGKKSGHKEGEVHGHSEYGGHGYH